MPLERASSNSGNVSGLGIWASKYLSTSAWSSIHQRGKKVVSASSGNTTNFEPRESASFSISTMRFTTLARLSARWMGPSWADETFRRRDMRSLLSLRQMAFGAHADMQDSDDPDAVVRDDIVEEVRSVMIAPHAWYDFAIVGSEQRQSTKLAHRRVEAQHVPHCDGNAPALARIERDPLNIAGRRSADPQSASHCDPDYALPVLRRLTTFLTSKLSTSGLS